MNYVLACLTLLQNGASLVTLKARGRAITIAVDITEITRRRFMTTLAVEKISIGTEEMLEEEGRTRAVSFMEITLSRSHVSVGPSKAEASHATEKESQTPPALAKETTDRGFKIINIEGILVILLQQGL